jgi:hypothetical protein
MYLLTEHHPLSMHLAFFDTFQTKLQTKAQLLKLQQAHHRLERNLYVLRVK